MNNKLVCLNNTYSTTRLLSRRKPEIVHEPGDKMKTMLLLPPHPERKGEGGLRTKGYFKYSYEIEDGRWYACDFRGRRLFEVESPEGFSVDLEEFKTKEGVIRLPLVSVVTVVLNGAKYLEETIQSVINQTYPNVEYIIIDGGSTDGTVDILKKYEDYIDYWVSEPDRGIYDAMNKGIKLTNGELINLLNSGDSYFDDNVVVYIINTYLKNKKPDIIHGDILVLDNNMKKIKRFDSCKFKFRFLCMTYNHPTFYVKRKCYSYIIYNDSFIYISDYGFTLDAVYNYNFNLHYIPKLLVKFREGGVSSSISLWVRLKEGYLIKRNVGFSILESVLSQFLRFGYFNVIKIKKYLKRKRAYR